MRTTQEPMSDDDFGPLERELLSRGWRKVTLDDIEDSIQVASDFAELQAEENRKADWWVNRFVLAVCAGIIGYAVGAALGYW